MTVEEQYASGYENNGWTNPENIVGEDDGLCASGTENLQKLDALFNFNIPSNAIIDDFEIDIKAVTSIEVEQCTIQIWEGTQWHIVADVDQDEKPNCVGIEGVPDSHSARWHGYKSKINRINTPEKVNNVKVRFWERTGGGMGDRVAWTTYADAVKCRVTYHLPSEKKVYGDGLFWRKA